MKIFKKWQKKLIEKLKTQEKKPKLKQKTQGPGGTRLFPLPKWC